VGWFFLAAALFAADPAWKSKPIAQWNAEDAKAVLTDSPWVKHVTPQRLRDLSPDERRNGGNMQAGIGNGVGLAGIGLFGSRREAVALKRAYLKSTPDAVVVRWESAPVRAAELRAGETAPVVGNAYYAVVVYDIPLPRRWNLASELKSVAYLKRYRKKDLKPSRVEILRGEGGVGTVVYLFRRSVEIARRDQSVEFVAQVDRLFLEQYFNVTEMWLLGKMEI
jgi:hypothetical protein